ncbi:MAG TPA: HigA family addiction module antitoxin [Acidobacteriaceae bacterium]|nr:HigA family addiction module antitoxin [Acidobacteriaceae bacterium]
MPGKLKSRTTTERRSIPRDPREHGVAIHPGEFLREDFMKPLGLSANALAIALRVPVTRITEIIRERRGVTVETAMRLGRYFGTSTEFWLNMQKAWELASAERELMPRIRAEVQPAPRDPQTHELVQRATA